MAKGYQKHKERLITLSSFGKALARRSSSSCELCKAKGVKLQVIEVPPVKDDPEYEQCIIICMQCEEQLNKPKQLNQVHWRCLYETVWSEVPAVQVIAVRVLKKLANNVHWAMELLDQVYLTPEVEAWVNEANLGE